MTLGGYIHSRLCGDGEDRQPRRRLRKPIKNDQALAQVLAMLGQSRLSFKLNQLARSANTGSLPMTPDTEVALNERLRRTYKKCVAC